VANNADIREYLLPAPDSFWEWRESAEVVTWKNGRTIAFREELRSVLSWLAPNGLPSLDSVILLLAATHDAWDANSEEARALTKMFDEPKMPLLVDVLKGLSQVRVLDASLRTPVRSKALLAEVVLERCRRSAEPELAMSIVEAMNRGLVELVMAQDIASKTWGYGPLLLLRDMADMLPALQQLDAERLRLRLATGLESLPEPAKVELSPSELARAVLEQLRDDVEFAGLARVAKQLLSVASLPRRLDVEENNPTGGFSDISNRGSIDRLLLSELANDDLTLAVRVAMNEALYLRREVPPSRPHNHRAVLIDAGIRSWGVPRVFATAVALALMAGTAKGGSYTCFRAKREAVERADLSTRAGLVEHLSALETELHPAAAVPAYLQQIQGDGPGVEPVLVMSEDALVDAAMQQSLRRIDLPQLFLATVSRDGVFRLSERGRYGIKVLREARIDLEDLFRERPAIINTRTTYELPAIFGREPFPLLLGENVARDRAFYIRNWGVASATGDGRLLRWWRPGQGAIQISDRIVGRILWTSPTAVDNHVSIVVGGSGNASLLRVSADNVIIDSVRLRPDAVGEKYCSHGGVLFLIQRQSVIVLSMQTGEVCQTMRLPAGVSWKRDRFFFAFNPPRWLALSHDGHSARFELVECAVPLVNAVGDEMRRLPPLISMFDQVGVDGPIGVLPDGNLLSTATGNLRYTKHSLRGALSMPWVSADGLRLRLTGWSAPPTVKSSVIVNTENLEVRSGAQSILDDRAESIIQTINLRHRFKAIGVDDSGKLALESRKGQLLAFDVVNGLPMFVARQSHSKLRASRPFEQLHGTQRRYRLAAATWEDGSRAVLDSRGLLHLASSDRSIPETTLVLAEGELTGWHSHGHSWGRPYFIGEKKRRGEDTAATQYLIFSSTVTRFVERLHA
jgi:hypothetical protein